MEKMFATVFVVALGLIFINAVTGCICPIKHPQQSFCDSDFVFVATVRGSEHIDGYLIYNMKVSHEKVYKGEEFIDRGEMYIQVVTEYHGSLCGRPNLIYLEKYLISGMVKNGNLEISYCDWVSSWDEVTPEQIKYLKRGTYAQQCQACTVEGVYSAHNNDMNDNLDTFDASQLSGKWSRYHCTYNPIASAMYVRKDCENQFAYCTQDVISGECMWKANDSYDECFNVREATWAIHHPKRPAFTHVRQCRDLPKRRLKKKCIKAVRRFVKANGRSTISELPIPL